MAEVEHTLPSGQKIIVDFDRDRKQVFNLSDIYAYRLVDDSSDVVVTAGKYVPIEDDTIIGYDLGLFRVARVDKTSYVADLKLWEVPKSGNDVGVEDVLLGVGPGYSSETWRCYLDTRVFPHRLDIDSRLHLYGSESVEIRVFKGIDITPTGEVISAYYNQSGTFVSDAIPLELVGTQQVSTLVLNPLVENLAVKAPVMGYTTKALADGELVTAVVYNNLGQVTSIAKLLVHNTNVIRHPDDSDKRVRSIELVSPYLSTTEKNVIEFPINATVATLALQAKVTYIDGETNLEDVVDEDANGKFKLLGLKYWSPTITGVEHPVRLVYQLSDGEYGYDQGESANGTLGEKYKIRVMPSDIAFSIKLFAYPTWINDNQGYGLEYWIYDLNRAVARRAPKAAVTLSDESMSFDGFDYTSVQHLKFSVDMSVVDASYGDYKHVQSSQIALLRDGGIKASNWKVKAAGNQPAYYGDNLMAPVRAGDSGLSKVNLTNGFASKAEWLTGMFYNTAPVYDPQTESQAPEPTHFIITTRTRTFTVAVSAWNTDITFVNDLPEGATMYLQWVKEMPTGFLQLGVSGLPVHAI